MDGRLFGSGLWLAQGFDEEAFTFQRRGVSLEWTVDAGEFELDAGVLSAPRPGPRLEVGFERETAVRLLAGEVPGRSNRVSDRYAEAPAFDQDPCNLGNCGLEIGDVLEGHECHGEICCTARDGEAARIPDDDVLATRLVCQTDHRRRRIDSDDPMAAVSE